MDVRGRVKDGVVILEAGPLLPEGAKVTVSCPDSVVDSAENKRRRVQLPLVPSDHPGSVLLTAVRVAELLDEADVSA